MPTATYVAFVSHLKRDKLRETLSAEDTGPLLWREERGRRGSEFYFTGPPALARKTHAFVVHWAASTH